MPAPSAEAHFNQFDALRIFAALLVLIGHCFELHSPVSRGGIGDPLLHYTGLESLGGVGVILFFAVSGYLVAESMLRTDSGFKFLWKRALRIYPALIVVVAISIVVIGPILSSLSLREYFSHELTWRYARNLLFDFQPYLPAMLENNPLPKGLNGSLWTLAIEVKLYVFLTLFCFLGSGLLRRIAIALYLLLFLGVFVWHFFVQPLPNVPYFENSGYATLKLWSAFLIGNCVRIYAMEIQLPKLIVANFLIFAGCAFFKNVFAWFAFTTLLALVAIYLGNCKSRGDLFWNRNDISYGTYLWAFPVQQCLMNFYPGINFYLFVTLTLLTTIALAYCSALLVEQPALRLKPSGKRLVEDSAPLAPAIREGQREPDQDWY
ncbi:acyltransferase [soil metagenome]